MLTLMRPYSYRTCRALQIMSEQHRCVGVSGLGVGDGEGREGRVGEEERRGGNREVGD